MKPRVESFLLGKSSKRSLRYLGYSVVLMAVFFGQRYLVGNFGTGNSSRLFVSPLGPAVSASVLAGIHTYRNDGVLVSIAVAVIVVSGYALYSVVSLTNPQPDYGLLTGAGTAVVYGTPMGITTSTIAYVLRRYAPSLFSIAAEEE